MTSTLSRPPMTESSIRRAAILFAGGPAPAANAVISTAAVSFLRNNIEVLGILHGYSHLVEFGPDHPLVEGRDYVNITQRDGAASNPILVIPFVELLSRILPAKLESMQIQLPAMAPQNSRTTSVMSSNWATPSVNPATPS